MKRADALKSYLEFVEYESRPLRGSLTGRTGEHHRVITISRQAGAGAHVVGEELVPILQARAPAGSPPWTVFDRNLVDRVLEDHQLPERLAQFMPEDRVSGISDTVEELFGLHPGTWSLVRKTADTILRLAELGNVVLIGRGANVITAGLDFAFHVRLVGSVPHRIRYVQEALQVDPEAAADYVRREDLGRKRYVKKYYRKDIDDPLLYHLVLNTDLVAYGEAARLIAEAVARTDASGRAGSEPRGRVTPSAR